MDFVKNNEPGIMPPRLRDDDIAISSDVSGEGLGVLKVGKQALRDRGFAHLTWPSQADEF